MIMAVDSLHGTLLSIAPSRDVIGAFLLLNLCAYLVVLISRKWTSSSKTTRSPTPDLEKPASRPGGKVTRKLGGKTILREEDGHGLTDDHIQ